MSVVPRQESAVLIGHEPVSFNDDGSVQHGPVALAVSAKFELDVACREAIFSATATDKSHLRKNIEDARRAFEAFVLATETAAGMR